MTSDVVARIADLGQGLVSRTEDGFSLTTEKELGADALADAAFLAFLRECQANAMTVHWGGSLVAEVPLVHLHHLPPPVSLGGVPAEALAAWVSSYRYGLCYHRRGPGFLQVKDARVPGVASRFVLDHPCLLATFLRCLTPCPAAALDAEEREAATLLAGEGLLWAMDGTLVTLPPQMRRWPVPFMSV